MLIRLVDTIRGRVAVLESLHVGLKSFLENIIAEIALDHAHKTSALAIRYGVKNFINFRRGGDVDLNGMRSQ